VKNQLEVLREQHGWSLGGLAGVNVSRQTINALETGRYDPSLPLAFRIARLFGQPIDAIFEPDPEPTASPPVGAGKKTRR